MAKEFDKAAFEAALLGMPNWRWVSNTVFNPEEKSELVEFYKNKYVATDVRFGVHKLKSSLLVENFLEEVEPDPTYGLGCYIPYEDWITWYMSQGSKISREAAVEAARFNPHLGDMSYYERERL